MREMLQTTQDTNTVFKDVQLVHINAKKKKQWKSAVENCGSRTYLKINVFHFDNLKSRLSQESFFPPNSIV